MAVTTWRDLNESGCAYVLIPLFIRYSQSSFAYNGLDFSLVQEGIAVQVAGSAIVLWDTRTGTKDYIW